MSQRNRSGIDWRDSEQRRAYHRAYYLAHQTDCQNYRREYVRAHRREIAEWRAAHHDELNAKRRAQYNATKGQTQVNGEESGMGKHRTEDAPYGSEERSARRRPGRPPKNGARSNALGTLIERKFTTPDSPVRSYSGLERHIGISREAISRYVTLTADRRRSPTIDTLAAIANAMHVSLEQIARAAAASALGIPLPDDAEAERRERLIAPLVATLSESQFAAVMELLRQIQGTLQGRVPGGKG